MTSHRRSFDLRKVGFFALVLLALAMVSAVVFVVVADEQAVAKDEVFPEIILVDRTKQPKFQFPEAVRTFDPSLNCFIDRFARICMEGKYSEFRLMCTTRVPPLAPRRFESIFNAVKEIRVLGVVRLPDMPRLPGPVYVMKAEYDLKDEYVKRASTTGAAATKSVQVALTREEGTWRIGPIPRDQLAALAVLQQTSSQPAVDLFDTSDVAPPDRPAANRSATLAPGA